MPLKDGQSGKIGSKGGEIWGQRREGKMPEWGSDDVAATITSD